MKLSSMTIALTTILAAIHYCQATVNDNNPEVACCHQKGGSYQLDATSITGNVNICVFNGRNYQAPYFLQTYCNGAPFVVNYQNCVEPNQNGFADTCLQCCVTQFNTFKPKCGDDQNCQGDNLTGVSSCQDDCATQCVEYCYQNDKTCVTQCIDTVGDTGLQVNCIQTCTEQYNTCNQQCAQQRQVSAGKIIP